MNNSRLEQLLQFDKESPNDSFILYAIALELQKSDPDQAKQYFEKILNNFPDYLAIYYTYGKIVEKTNKPKAQRLYKKGMEIALNEKNSKTYNELCTALKELEDHSFDEW